jgi:hypothetical protein
MNRLLHKSPTSTCSVDFDEQEMGINAFEITAFLLSHNHGLLPMAPSPPKINAP